MSSVVHNLCYSSTVVYTCPLYVNSSLDDYNILQVLRCPESGFVLVDINNLNSILL